MENCRYLIYLIIHNNFILTLQYTIETCVHCERWAGFLQLFKNDVSIFIVSIKKWENVSSHLSSKWMSFQPKRSNNDIRRICQYHFQIMEIADFHRVILFLFLRKGGNTNRLIFENIALRQNDNILSLT